ncbi:N-lysine methyltransferase setd6-like [Diadema setosum]|uniref:N-lysine methyltransferase setd6-like n=1 Tax=Diadema setosum TaxID=31175 RepID=UPI003B3BB014
MAAPMTKRQRDDREENTTCDQNSKPSKVLYSDCARFLDWCREQGIDVNPKVTVDRHGSCAQCGMVAVEDISKGEVLFMVPRAALLHPETCSSLLSSRLKEGASELISASGWVPLILTVMYEYGNAQSKWRPYLDLFPDYNELDPPMFWDSSFLEQELQGTGVPEVVVGDIHKMTREYEEVALPFIEKNPDIFSTEVHTLELYKKIVAFVMAYSFTDPGNDDDEDDDDDAGNDDDDDKAGRGSSRDPMMVPLADALNHIAKNNAHLNFGKESLTMVAVSDIKKGEEVFNTYGDLANWELLHMYGFAEEHAENCYDTVDIPCRFLYEEVRRLHPDDKETLEEKWTYLTEGDILRPDGSFIVGVSGILTDEELYTALKVLTMENEKFVKYLEDDEWCSDDGTDESLENENLPKLPEPWREILSVVASRCLEGFAITAQEDQGTLSDPERLSKLSSRSRYSLYVRTGQRELLERLRQLHT